MVLVVNSQQFGKNISACRRKRKLSQKCVAPQCGISIYRLRRTEQGYIIDIEDHVMNALCLALEKRLEELLY